MEGDDDIGLLDFSFLCLYLHILFLRYFKFLNILNSYTNNINCYKFDLNGNKAMKVYYSAAFDLLSYKES